MHLRSRVLEELKTERMWESSFANSENILDKPADEALTEDTKGDTKPLDI